MKGRHAHISTALRRLRDRLGFAILGLGPPPNADTVARMRARLLDAVANTDRDPYTDALAVARSNAYLDALGQSITDLGPHAEAVLADVDDHLAANGNPLARRYRWKLIEPPATPDRPGDHLRSGLADWETTPLDPLDGGHNER